MRPRYPEPYYRLAANGHNRQELEVEIFKSFTSTVPLQVNIDQVPNILIRQNARHISKAIKLFCFFIVIRFLSLNWFR